MSRLNHDCFLEDASRDSDGNEDEIQRETRMNEPSQNEADEYDEVDYDDDDHFDDVSADRYVKGKLH